MANESDDTAPGPFGVVARRSAVPDLPAAWCLADEGRGRRFRSRDEPFATSKSLRIRSQRAEHGGRPAVVWPVRSIEGVALGLAEGSTYPLAGEFPARPRLAIVGSRAASTSLRRVVPTLVEAAARAGFSIVSGGARGIDADAHRAALAQGLAQAVIVPAGPDRPYPPEHVPLFEDIVRQGRGALLFARPAGSRPNRAIFASRNRLVVTLADAVVIVQAQSRSGTMITGKEALRQGKPIAAVLGSPGAAWLVGAGAAPLRADDPCLARTCSAWLEAVASGSPSPRTTAWPSHLALLRQAFERAGPGGLGVNELGLPEAVALVEAETLGLVVESSPGRWVPA